jgi:hypothetical protein
MGEAKLKRTFRDCLIAEHRYCIYCGGVTPSEEVDHVPPRVMFKRKHRPKGMEFAACAECNRNASRFEMVAAIIGRISPDKDSPEWVVEWGKFLREADSNNPGLLEELQPSLRQLREARAIPNFENSGALNVAGPIVQNSIRAFGAKLGLALHYHHTGRIVPNGGAVAVKWFSNHDKLTGRFPDSLLNILSARQTLKQGRFSVGDQFQFSSAVANTGQLAAYLATFNFAFATLSVVAESKEKLADLMPADVYSPGFMRSAR